MTFASRSEIHQPEQRADSEHDGGNDEPYEEDHRYLLCRAELTTGRASKPDSQSLLGVAL
jgi:hypothetical protein